MNSVGSVYNVDQTYVLPVHESQMHQTNSAEVVTELLADAKPGDLVVFDVDEVLITLKDRFLRINATPISDPIFFSIFTPFTDPDKLKLFGEWISQVEVELISDKLRDAIVDLKARGCMLMGLTSMIPGAGSAGKIPFMEDFRFNELKVRGIDFRGSFNFDRLEIDLPEKNGRKPLFKDAILYARPYSKGTVFKTFLVQQAIVPRKIWFIDNDQKHVDDVLETAKELKIPYVGIQYLDAKFATEEFDVGLGKFQFEHFQKTQIWLNDEQAREAKKNC
jgi:hypothetical protein